MPSPEPTIIDMLKAAQTAVQGAGDKNADFIRGSDYESLLGPAAIIWSRQAQRDTDLFNAVNFHTADGDDLTQMALKRYGKVRVVDSNGSGTATITRPSGGIAETIWAGTRLLLTGSSSRLYRVTANTALGSGVLTATLPIEAVDVGPGTAVSVSDSTGTKVLIYDTIKDSSWKVTALSCADGTLFEQADAFRSRIRTERLAERVGQDTAIIATCKTAGAANVVLFRSNYAGLAYDHGLNVCYVGDSGYSGSPTLVKACTLALRATRVQGDSLQVLQMTPGTVSVSANVYLNDSPGKFNLTRLQAIHSAAITQYMNGSSGTFAYSIAGIRGAIIRNTPEVQRVDILNPTVDATVVTGPDKNFPFMLTRYALTGITLNYFSN